MDDFIDRLKSGDAESWLLAFAVYALVVGAYSLYRYVRIGSWPSVVGRLNCATVGGQTASIVPSDRTYAAEVSYRYTIDGKTYEGTRLSPFLVMATYNLRSLLRHQLKGIQTTENGGVRVFYNPQQPENSYLISTNSVGYAAIAGATVLPLVGYFLYAA